jgi:hypothetical protein
MTWALRALRWSYCAFIVWASLQTFLSAQSAHDLHALVLSGGELLAIVAFLFEGIEIHAAIALIVIYTVAAIATTFAGHMPIRFVYFAVTAFYIVYARRSLKTDIAYR